VGLVERLLQLGGYPRLACPPGVDAGPLIRPLLCNQGKYRLKACLGTTLAPILPPAYTTLLHHCKRMCKAAGLQAFTLHSGRIGGMSQALTNGADLELCQVHGRWASTRSRDLYIRTPLAHTLSVSVLALQQ
jgi:hypothetical protein